MGLDEELENLEDGAETEAEQIDEETETEDLEEFQDDEEFDPNAEETDLEEAYEGFFAEEGPDGEGEVSSEGDDGGLAAVVSEAEGVDLSEEGFHIVGGDGEVPVPELYEEGSIDDYDADEIADEVEEVEGGEPSQIDAANAQEEADDGVEDVAIVEPSEDEEGYELVELELDEDDIVRYLEDEDGELIGFVLLEDGEEVEYLYVEDEEADGSDDDEDNEFDLGITKEGVAQATSDVNAIYKDGIAVAAELKGAFDDIKEAFSFGSILKK